MFNLKAIQKTILFLSITVFLISFILILYFTISNPNGFLANNSNVKPITTFTNTNVQRLSYGEKMRIKEDVKVKDDVSTIVAQDLDATLLSKNELSLNGLIYIKNSDILSVSVSSLLNVELSKGEYFINTNPIKIHIISGEVFYKQEKVGVVNQTIVWQVDRFKASTLNTDDFVINRSYTNLLNLLKDINLLPSQLTNISLNITNSDTILVSDSEEVDSNCTSDLLIQKLFCDINVYRKQNNLKILNLDEDLNQLTLSHVVWMDSNQSTSTLESNGLSYLERCVNYGFECNAEINLKLQNYNELSVYNQVIQNKNILNKDSSLIGINVAGDYLSILLR